MRIGELSRQTGVDQRLLRYYEHQGLLHPTRLPNGYRAYQDADVVQVAWIRRLLAAGLSTATIAGFAACPRDPAQRPTAACDRLVSRLRGERTRLDAAIDDLTRSRAVLDELITAASNR
jgi:DNA-binding transcriptional MerR regulator